MEKSLAEFCKCDSCGKLYPKEMVKEIKFSFNTKLSGAKEKLMTETMHGIICLNCAQAGPITTDKNSEESVNFKSKPTVTKKTYGRK